MQKILEIPLVLLDDFPSFPFRLRRDSEFLNLLDSISTYGVLQPVIVRPIAERYQLISGHRRKRACEILRFDSVFGIVLHIVKYVLNTSAQSVIDEICDRHMARRRFAVQYP